MPNDSYDHGLVDLKTKETCFSPILLISSTAACRATVAICVCENRLERA